MGAVLGYCRKIICQTVAKCGSRAWPSKGGVVGHVALLVTPRADKEAMLDRVLFDNNGLRSIQ